MTTTPEARGLRGIRLEWHADGTGEWRGMRQLGNRITCGGFGLIGPLPEFALLGTERFPFFQ